MQVIKMHGYKWEVDYRAGTASQRGGARHVLSGVTDAQRLAEEVRKASIGRFGLRGKANRGASRRAGFSTPPLDKQKLKDSLAPDAEKCASFHWHPDGTCTVTFLYPSALQVGQYTSREQMLTNAEALAYRWQGGQAAGNTEPHATPAMSLPEGRQERPNGKKARKAAAAIG